MGVGLVPHQFEVFKTEGKDIPYLGGDFHHRQGMRGAGQLLSGLLINETASAVTVRTPEGETVVLQSGAKKIAGISRGVDDRGALVLETAQGRQLAYGGEISLRSPD